MYAILSSNGPGGLENTHQEKLRNITQEKTSHSADARGLVRLLRSKP